MESSISCVLLNGGSPFGWRGFARMLWFGGACPFYDLQIKHENGIKDANEKQGDEDGNAETLRGGRTSNGRTELYNPARRPVNSF
jgi:hypothetical protein